MKLHYLENSQAIRIVWLLEELKCDYEVIVYKRDPKTKLAPKEYKALLLSAGFGTRLRPITNEIPKCLVEINKKPILHMWLDKLQNIEINSVLINTHYLANKVYQEK